MDLVRSGVNRAGYANRSCRTDPPFCRRLASRSCAARDSSGTRRTRRRRRLATERSSAHVAADGDIARLLLHRWVFDRRRIPACRLSRLSGSAAEAGCECGVSHRGVAPLAASLSTSLLRFTFQVRAPGIPGSTSLAASICSSRPGRPSPTYLAGPGFLIEVEATAVFD